MRLILLGVVTLFGLVSINFSAKILNDKEKYLFSVKTEINTINEHVLTIRKHEKDFLARGDIKYEKALHDEIKELFKHIDGLVFMVNKANIKDDELKEIKKIISAYKAVFDELATLQKEIGLTHEDGLRGAMRKAIHEAESFFKELKDYKMQTLMLTLRRTEKDFLMRSLPKYIANHATNYEKALDYINSTKNQEIDLTSSLPLMKLYRDSFVKISDAFVQRGIDHKSGVHGKLRDTVHKTEEFIKSASINIQKEIDSHIAQTITIYISLAIGIVGIILVLTTLIIRSIMIPLRVLTDQIISNDRDLSIVYKAPYKDELREIADALNAFMGKLRGVVSEAIKASDENAAVAHELSSTSMNIGQRAEEESAIIQSTSRTGKIAKDNITSSVLKSNEAQTEIGETNKSLEDTNKVFTYLISDIKKTAEVEHDLQAKMNTLAQDAEQVKDVLNVINEIADQTNLLALNAAIEAARAGEHGRGFAVVADEVRKLAERTQKSLIEINATVNVIVQAITDASLQMDQNGTLFTKLVEQSQTVSKKILSSVELMTHSVKTVEISASTTEKSGQEIEKAMNEMEHINEISMKNARDLEEIASAADHLHQVTQKLNDKLHYFKV